ncbi:MULTISPECIES: YceI family protein [unclassified Sphingomonas]|uniref:YceI family protein n=1 Tax=unclassified Sphingomonas TaxID=196159 RepID=UPI0009283265|nr:MULTISPECIES: YceI family protein [unclassified Sphingomonas]OJU15021.1 MAG: polyisoprenoid-binding protein [Sphingomonas sp. 66-10]
MTFRPLKAAALAAAFVVTPALVLAQSAMTTPAAVQAGTYGVEPYHTRVLFAVSHLGFSTWYGEFTGASGSLTLDPAKLGESQVDISVPAASISTSNAKLDDELKGDKWFDVAKYDMIRFRSTRITRTGANSADIAGNLTLHGVTRPVVLKARFNAAGVNPLDKAYTVGFEVSGDIKRSDFGVTTYVPMVGDDVHLIISAAFEKKVA